MKKYNIKLSVASLKMLLFLGFIFLSNVFFAQNVNIPDSNFKAELLSNALINTNSDTAIQISEASSYIGLLNVSNKNINDLTGIEAFTSLTELNCSNNFLINLDISSNTNLTSLDFSNNSVSSFDASFSVLDYLDCSNNSLSNLIINNGNNINFTYFDSRNNAYLSCIQVDDIVWSTSNWSNIDLNSNFGTDCSSIVNIVSANFKTALLSDTLINTNRDSEIQQFEASAYNGNLNISGKSITTLTGIQSFSSIIGLDCSNNFMTDIDLSLNPTILSLNCSTNNNLSNLNVKNGNNTNFSFFDASNNQNLYCIQVDDTSWSASNWTSIDSHTFFGSDCYSVVNIPDFNFKSFLLADSTINVNGDSEIQVYEAEVVDSLIFMFKNINNLTGIEAFTSLVYLKCPANNIVDIDVSSNTSLLYIDCSSNSLINLTLSPSITHLRCSNNSLTNLNLTLNQNLDTLSVSSNSLSTLDISQNGLLSYLECGYNLITNLDISNNPALTYLDIQNNQLTMLNTSLNSNLLMLSCSSNPLSTLDISNNTNLIELYCASNQLTNLDISNNPNLVNLYCSDNLLTNLDASNKSNLLYFECTNNPLISLNLSNNTVLEEAYCMDNSLTTLTITNTNSLKWFYCNNNSITELDCSNKVNLIELDCSNNQLEHLNIKNGTNTILTYFNAINNLNLNCIQVDDITWSSSNWTDIDAQSSFSTDCDSIINIPDVNFKTALLATPSINFINDGEIYFYEASVFSDTINVNNLNISDLTGIESFISLVGLNCSNNNLTSLDISSNSKITYLSCNTNSLSSLKVNNGNNINFTYFDARNNLNLYCIQVDDTAWSIINWTNIDPQSGFNNNCSASVIIPDANFKTALLSNNLINTNSDSEIQVYEASLYSGTINVSNQNISDLTGIEAFTSINELDCSTNTLIRLDVSTNINLTLLDCNNNSLTNLDVNNGNNLNFTFFDARNNPNLTCIQVDDIPWSTTNWTNIDLSSSFDVDCYPVVFIPDTNFKSALLNNPTINSNSDNEIQVTEASNYSNPLNISGKNIYDLTGLEAFVSLVNIDCSNNNLSSLNISSNTNVTSLNFSNNTISSFDASFTVLTDIDCSNNTLSNLNVNNGLNTNFTYFDARNNPNLTCIQVDNSAWSTTNWTNIDLTSSFGSDCFSIVNIPNTNFKSALLSNTAINTNGDNEIQVFEANAFSDSIIVNSRFITDLTGIEAFSSVVYLDCNDNSITNLDLSQNTALKYIICNNNALTSINVTQNSDLELLDCNNNSLTSLNISQNPLLTTLNCYNNSSLYFLNVINNPALTYLSCSNIHLSNLDLSNNTLLTFLNCELNTLLNLDLTNNTSLTQIHFGHNNFQSIDLSANQALTKITCYGNLLTSLDLSSNTALTSLNCVNNYITDLDLSLNTLLNRIECADNSLTSLNIKNGNNSNFSYFDAQNNPNLTCVQVDDIAWSTTNWINLDAQTSFDTLCNYNLYIPDPNFKTALLSNSSLNTNSDNEIQTLEAMNYTDSLDVSNNNIADLTGIEAFTSISYLDCSYNLLTNLNLSTNNSLLYLNCSNNLLTNIDVLNDTLLIRLNCSNNLLSSLSLPSNARISNNKTSSSNNYNLFSNSSITHIDCSFNPLIELDVSDFTNLVSLKCNNDSLSSLNVKNGNNINFILFDVLNNPNLTCIQVDDDVFSYSNWPNKDSLATYNTNCSVGIISLIHDDKSVVIYPIPTSEKLFIDPRDHQVTEINIFDITGVKLLSQLGIGVINVSNLPSGIYFIELIGENYLTTKKFIKK